MKTRASKIITISLPPQLYRRAMRTAKAKGMTRSELFREALRRFEVEDQEWRALFEYGRKKAAAASIRTEKDVERLIDESRS
jgi:metal-responsive CopG/Arc/MetJ family transcriptional regulator